MNATAHTTARPRLLGPVEAIILSGLLAAAKAHPGHQPRRQSKTASAEAFEQTMSALFGPDPAEVERSQQAHRDIVGELNAFARERLQAAQLKLIDLERNDTPLSHPEARALSYRIQHLRQLVALTKRDMQDEPSSIPKDRTTADRFQGCRYRRRGSVLPGPRRSAALISSPPWPPRPLSSPGRVIASKGANRPK